MKTEKVYSIRKQLNRIVVTSSLISFAVISITFFIYQRRSSQEEMSKYAIRLLESGIYQADQIIPGLLVEEQYGSVSQQLDKIRSIETLSKIEIRKSPISELSKEFTQCHRYEGVNSNNQNLYCIDLKSSTISIINQIGPDSRVLGYLIKTKLIQTGAFGFNLSNPLIVLSIGFALSILMILIWLSTFLDRFIRKPLVALEKELEPALKTKSLPSLRNFKVSEINAIAANIQTILDAYHSRKTEAALGELASQVVHDIRSPLAALDLVVSNMTDLPEENRIIVRSAVTRIKDISNNLLNKNKLVEKARTTQTLQTTNRPQDSLLLSSLIENLVTEKRAQYSDRSKIEILYTINSEAYGHFVEVDPVEFKRVLSNIINNSVEALDLIGRITVITSEKLDNIEIKIQDDGKGISPEVLPLLMKRGNTFKKPNGSGLGLYHAKSTIESWGGSVEISSQLGFGTTVTLKLPRAVSPKWFVPQIKILTGSKIVILDDDPSVHHIWRSRFSELNLTHFGIEVFHFSSPKEIRNWAKSASQNHSQYICLIDYELLGSRVTGLDLIEELNLAKYSILVTSRYEEPAVLSHCEKLNIKLIPKAMAGFVPISLESKFIQTSTHHETVTHLIQ